MFIESMTFNIVIINYSNGLFLISNNYLYYLKDIYLQSCNLNIDNRTLSKANIIIII